MQSMGDLLEGMLPDKLAGVLLRQSGIKTAAAAEGISKERIEKLAAVIKGMRLSVKAASGFEKAQDGGRSLCGRG